MYNIQLHIFRQNYFRIHGYVKIFNCILSLALIKPHEHACWLCIVVAIMGVDSDRMAVLVMVSQAETVVLQMP